jgi:hypothetical protein
LLVRLYATYYHNISKETTIEKNTFLVTVSREETRGYYTFAAGLLQISGLLPFAI